MSAKQGIHKWSYMRKKNYDCQIVVKQIHVLRCMECNSPASDKLLNKKMFFMPDPGISSVL